MAMETNGSTRPLRDYVSDLLQFPRRIIEGEVDFTSCPYDSHYNPFLPECDNCQFGRACHWLDQRRTQTTNDAPLDELVQALKGAVNYLQSAHRRQESDDAELRDWIEEASRFLASRRV